MYYRIANKVNQEDVEVVLKGYYKFYENLCGVKRIFPKTLSKIPFSLDENKLRWIDKFDSILKLSRQAVININSNEEVKVLNIYTDFCELDCYDVNIELAAFARFIVDRSLNELRVMDIIFLKDDILKKDQKKVLKESIITKIFEFLEHHAKELGLDAVIIEIPWMDEEYLNMAEKSQYILEDGEKLGYNITSLFKKEIESKKQYGRHRINKQAQGINE